MESAYHVIDAFLKKQGAEGMEVRGTPLPLHYGAGISQEIETLRHKAGLLDLKAADLVALEGPDAGTFL